jgi:hypothetical protein
MKKNLPALLLVSIFLAACSNTNLVDSDWLLEPGGSGNAYAVEHEEGDMICLVDREDPTIRSCVPRVHKESGEK